MQENSFSTLNANTGQNHPESNQKAAWSHLDQLTKPPRSLGRVEEIAVRLCQIQNTQNPTTRPRSVLVFAGDHGVCEEGVSAFPPMVTVEMLKNMATGGAAVSVLSRLHQAKLRVIDVGSRFPANDSVPGVERRSIRTGTRNFTKSEAMTIEETQKTVELGRACIHEEARNGVRLMILGEMGIGNTTSASALCSVILQRPVQDMTGRGTGLDDEGLKRKISTVEKALAFHQGKYSDGYTLLSCLGGFEIAAMTGAILQAYEEGIPILLDGFIVSTSALVASTIHPRISDCLIAAHVSLEPGHRHVLNALHLCPILNLDMRLGEASGALVALPVLDAAVAIFNEMATFQTAGVCLKQS